MDDDVDRQPTRRDALVGWLSRGKIWDDVFTRTVSILISASIVAGVGVAVGAIHLTHHGKLRALLFVLALAWCLSLTGLTSYYQRHRKEMSRGKRDVWVGGTRALLLFGLLGLLFGLAVIR